METTKNAIGGAIFLVVFFWVWAAIQSDPEKTPVNDAITLENYNRITEGDSKADVEAILGQGELTQSLDGIEYYQYWSSDSGSLTVVYSDGRLYTKYQSGLN